MNRLHALYHIARADFLERVRRQGFLLVMAGAAWLAYETFVGHVALRVNESRGVYNAAWVGGMMTLVTTTFLSLFGFYIVKNCVARDESTGVGQVLAATRMGRVLYTFGKALSNFAVLALIVLVLALGAFAMQMLRGEDRTWDPAGLMLPFVLVALPAMAVVAALAVLFECVGWARGGGGNALYFFVWGGALGAFVATHHDDPLGFTVMMGSMEKAITHGIPAKDIGFSLSIAPPRSMGTFLWTGVSWTRALVWGRLAWFGWAAGLTLVAAAFFDRFDPSRRNLRQMVLPEGAAFEEAGEAGGATSGVAGRPVHLELPPLTARGGSFLAVLTGELRLLVKSANVWWWLVQGGLFVASLFTPFEVSTQRLLVFLWIWPLLSWSALGAREAMTGTQQLVFSSPRPLARQLAATWLSGFALAFLSAAGVMLRLAAAGHFTALAGAVAGSIFIPSLAVALGAWSGTARLFEIVYLLIWYIGPLNQVGFADFTGSCPEAVAAHAWSAWLAVSVVLLTIARQGRRRRLQS